MHTILVADDSVTILKAVEIVFDKEPFQVVKAGSGAEAIARAKELRPALVLADHAMGDKSGYEVAEALRSDPSTSAIPVMILSAAQPPYDEGRARAAGVIGNVQKPFDCQTLLDRVRNVLGVAATAPGTFAPANGGASVGASPALAGMPRPPGIGGAASSLPRPPSLGGATIGGAAASPATRPAAVGSGAPASTPMAASSVSASPLSSSPLSSSPLSSSTPMARAPTPQPARSDLDPFGFGASLSTPPQSAPSSSGVSSSGVSSSVGSASMGASIGATPAAVSTPPRAASTPSTATSSGTGGFANPFATSTPIGGASSSLGGGAVSSPSSISGATSPQTEPWRTARGPDAFDARPSTPAATLSSTPSTSAAKTASPSYAGDSEFLEVADIEVNDIPVTTPKVEPRVEPKFEPRVEPKPATPVVEARPTAADIRAQQETKASEEKSLDDSRATDKIDLARLARLDTEAAKRAEITMEPVAAAVADKAAAQIAKAGGAAPSKEALTEEARQIVERIAWEVVPELAEVIIREEIQRLLKSRS